MSPSKKITAEYMLQNIAAVPMQDPLYALRIPSRVLSFKLFE